MNKKIARWNFLYVFVGIFSIIVVIAGYSYWISLRSTRNINSYEPIMITKEIQEITKSTQNELLKMEASLKEIKTNGLVEPNSIDAIHSSLIKLKENHNISAQLYIKNYAYLHFQLKNILTNIEKAAASNIDRSTVTFFFVMISALLLSMFLVLYLNSLEKIDKFNELINSTERKFETYKQSGERVEKMIKQIDSENDINNLILLDTLQFMDENGVKNFTTNLLGKELKKEERLYVAKRLEENIDQNISNISEDRKTSVRKIINEVIQQLRAKENGVQYLNKPNVVYKM